MAPWIEARDLTAWEDNMKLINEKSNDGSSLPAPQIILRHGLPKALYQYQFSSIQSHTDDRGKGGILIASNVN